jgi:hypothetical protein
MTEIITRADALSKGLKRYFTGKACHRGHVTDRFVTSWSCVECKRENTAASLATQEGQERQRRYSRESMAKSRAVAGAWRVGRMAR